MNQKEEKMEYKIFLWTFLERKVEHIKNNHLKLMEMNF